MTTHPGDRVDQIQLPTQPGPSGGAGAPDAARAGRPRPPARCPLLLGPPAVRLGVPPLTVTG